MDYKAYRKIYLISFILGLGGLLYGLSIAEINGSLTILSNHMHLTSFQGEQYAGILPIGCIFGTLFASLAARYIGRKKTLIFFAFMFVLAPTINAISMNLFMLYESRFFIGFAIGGISITAPLYLSEISPAKIRGQILAIFSLFTTTGILLIYCSNCIIGHYLHSWRVMIIVITLPAIIMFIFLLFIPSSPRWLVFRNKRRKAFKTLMKLLDINKETAEEKVSEIEKSINDKASANIIDLFKKKFFLKTLIIGILLMVCQQFTGINVIMFYSSTILKSIGIGEASISTIIIGLINVISTILVVKYIDKIGRKKIIYLGSLLMFTSLVVLGLTWHMTESGNSLNIYIKAIIVFSCLLYVASFAFSVGPITSMLCAEIFPIEGKDIGLGITTIVQWFSCAIVVGFIFSIAKVIGLSIMFLIFSLICVCVLVFVAWFIPETNGLTLEKIEKNLKEK